MQHTENYIDTYHKWCLYYELTMGYELVLGFTQLDCSHPSLRVLKKLSHINHRLKFWTLNISFGINFFVVKRIMLAVCWSNVPTDWTVCKNVLDVELMKVFG